MADDQTELNSEAIVRVVGNSIRRYREAAGLSQERLAERIGQPAKNLRRWEAGKQEPTLASLYQIAKILELAPGALLPPLDDSAEGRGIGSPAIRAALAELEKAIARNHPA